MDAIGQARATVKRQPPRIKLFVPLVDWSRQFGAASLPKIKDDKYMKK